MGKPPININSGLDLAICRTKIGCCQEPRDISHPPIRSRSTQVCPTISKSIEIRRALKSGVLQGKFLIFCALALTVASLHKGEARGSSPLSPTDLYRCVILPPPLIGKESREDLILL